ncbi:Hypothetical predicted protein [Octopus vulgaris]|uniref:Uncharacterized protein n=1 Tax=Octopus vulgaris TaxID=6645 RepID=A0AA36BEF0_OCTVU|nr:Hypothetical predicted protein [Octopus vulgaris]
MVAVHVVGTAGATIVNFGKAVRCGGGGDVSSVVGAAFVSTAAMAVTENQSSCGDWFIHISATFLQDLVNEHWQDKMTQTR